MSIALAYKRDGVVYFAADTREIVNDNKVCSLSPSCYKIEKLDNGIILSVVGEKNVEQVIKAYSEIFTLDENGTLTKKHLVKSVVPALCKVLKENELFCRRDNEFPYMKAQIMLAYEGELFEICSNFFVIKYEDYLAIGRADTTLATLFSMKREESPNQAMVRALDISSKYNQSVARPYVLINTRDKEFSIVRGKENGNSKEN